ncbi:hypothetical protein E2C01_059696 [Portunus trituberculatus]|uniref:Uncharacterized protein n=1 Tax=Portunus trituberculatus TaxID=210409 RepID=A0A5B7H945_PORTR|nr:hypothetical protein [Portunus trituberculatus]
MGSTVWREGLVRQYCAWYALAQREGRAVCIARAWSSLRKGRGGGRTGRRLVVVMVVRTWRGRGATGGHLAKGGVRGGARHDRRDRGTSFHFHVPHPSRSKFQCYSTFSLAFLITSSPPAGHVAFSSLRPGVTGRTRAPAFPSSPSELHHTAHRLPRPFVPSHPHLFSSLSSLASSPLAKQEDSCSRISPHHWTPQPPPSVPRHVTPHSFVARRGVCT